MSCVTLPKWHRAAQRAEVTKQQNRAGQDANKPHWKLPTSDAYENYSDNIQFRVLRRKVIGLSDLTPALRPNGNTIWTKVISPVM